MRCYILLYICIFIPVGLKKNYNPGSQPFSSFVSIIPRSYLLKVFDEYEESQVKDSTTRVPVIPPDI